MFNNSIMNDSFKTYDELKKNVQRDPVFSSTLSTFTPYYDFFFL